MNRAAGWWEWSGTVKGFSGVSKSISPTLPLLLLCSFFYLTVVSSKLFISQRMIFSFCGSNSSLHLMAGEEEEQAEVRKQYSGWCVSVGIPNWRIPFLNHNCEIELLLKLLRINY